MSSRIWREITGYRYRYRISDQAQIQKFDPRAGWTDIATKISWNRLHVTLRGLDGKQHKVAVVNLMDAAFFGGYARRNGLKIAHKNRARADCSAENLYFTTQSEIGQRNGAIGRRKPVIVTRRGESIIYGSVTEAAEKTGLTRAGINRRLRGEVLDQKGRVFEYDE